MSPSYNLGSAFMVSRAANQARAMSYVIAIFVVLFVWGGLLLSKRERLRADQMSGLREELASTRERVRLLVEQAPEGILEFDTGAGLCVEANLAAARVLGRERDDILGRGIVDFTPRVQPDGRESAAVWSGYCNEARSGEQPVFEWTVALPDQTARALEVRLVMHPEAGLIRASVTDISERVHSREVLERSEDRFRTLVEYAPGAMVLVDVDTMSFAEVNPSAAEMFGYTRDELLRLRPIRVFSEIQPDGRRARVIMEEAMQQVLANRGVVETEIVARRKTGQEFHASLRSVLLPGERLQVRSMITDVTEHLVREDALRIAKEEAERASRAKTAFLAHMSHEIRTPMNGVLGMLELLMDSDLSLEQRQSAELARSSAEALLTVLNDVLDISKIEAGQFVLEEIPFELHGLVNSIVGVVAPMAAKNGVEVHGEIGPDVPEVVIGDPVRLRQVLSNLVNNAVKFTRDGEVRIRLSAEGKADTGVGIGFSVRDTGTGIAAGRLESIFEPFVQADDSITRRFGGTGLGLAICRQLVRLMGGTLEVDSELGRGSEFRFSLSLARSAQPASRGSDRDLGGCRILLVDANSTTRRTRGEAFESACARMMAAGDVYSAMRAARIAVAEEDPFAVAVVDSGLPEQGASEFIRAVDADRNLSGLKVVMLTDSDAGPEDFRDSAVISARLPKSISQATIIESIRRLLDGEPQASEPSIRGDLDGSRSRLTVLLAEDNAVNQRVASAMLRKRGHEVDVVGDGLAAVEAVKSGRYDVVLMDVQMPELDGIEATRRLREEGFGGRIVALTAHATSDDREMCLSAGMDDFLTKPFQSQKLFSVVEQGPSGGRSSTEAVASSDEVQPVDIPGFRAAMEEAGVPEIVEETLRSYLQESPQRLRWLEEAMTSGDTDEVRKAAHALKSSSGAIGANALARCLEQTEREAKSGRLDDAVGRRVEIRELYELVVNYLEHALSVST